MADGQLLFKAGIHTQLNSKPGHDQSEDDQTRQYWPAMPEKPLLDARQHATPPFDGHFYRSIHDMPHKVREITKPA
ncbi:hypothetical protein D3C75_791420 [compost metagenome]